MNMLREYLQSDRDFAKQGSNTVPSHMYTILVCMRHYAKKIPLLVKREQEKHPEFFDSDGLLREEIHEVSEAERQYKEKIQWGYTRFKGCMTELFFPTGAEPCVVGEKIGFFLTPADFLGRQTAESEYTENEQRFVDLYNAYTGIDRACTQHGIGSPPPEMRAIFEQMKECAQNTPSLRDFVLKTRQDAQNGK